SPNVDSSQGFHIAEGPVWIQDALYFSVIFGTTRPPGGRIERFTEGQGTVFLANAASNGLAVDLMNRVYATDHAGGTIKRYALNDPSSITVIADSYQGARFNSPNDLAVHSNGSVYFTDPDWQAPAVSPQAARRVYWVAPDGTVSAIEDGSAFSEGPGGPNGIQLSLDESKLYVSGNAPKLLRFSIAADGSATPDGEIDLTADAIGISGGLDGMTMDCAGHLYVTHGASVTVLDVSMPEDVKRIGAISVSGQATNVAFGRTTLYITSLNDPEIHTIDVGLPGLPY
ncbi:MAG: SMP-30/gluconolactonase/LRE family protein, partial [Myxococcota bacterium]